MRIPLLAGRDFDWRDAQPELPSAVIVNESFARRYFPGESALGKRFFRIDGGATLVAQEIIGVAADAKYTSIREATPPTVYDPFRPEERRRRFRCGRDSNRAPGRHAARRTATVPSGVSRDRRYAAIHTRRQHLVRDRALALLSAFFSIVAIVLVAVGLYGVLSYSVVQRTREIGIRLALGARPVRVMGVVVGEVATVTAIGLVVGVAAGWRLRGS